MQLFSFRLWILLAECTYVVNGVIYFYIQYKLGCSALTQYPEFISLAVEDEDLFSARHNPSLRASDFRGLAFFI